MDLFLHILEELNSSNLKLLKERVVKRKNLERKIRREKEIRREKKRAPYYMTWKKTGER